MANVLELKKSCVYLKQAIALPTQPKILQPLPYPGIFVEREANISTLLALYPKGYTGSSKLSNSAIVL